MELTSQIYTLKRRLSALTGKVSLAFKKKTFCRSVCLQTLSWGNRRCTSWGCGPKIESGRAGTGVILLDWGQCRLIDTWWPVRPLSPLSPRPWLGAQITFLFIYDKKMLISWLDSGTACGYGLSPLIGWTSSWFIVYSSTC